MLKQTEPHAAAEELKQQYVSGEREFANAGLSGTNLQGTDLSGANLAEANLEGANLVDTNLEDTNLKGANLSGANLHGARLYRADLKKAHLYGANLCEANLEDTILSDAYLEGANLYGANLDGAILSHANLEGANLYGADLENAVFYCATIDGANVDDPGRGHIDLKELPPHQIKNTAGSNAPPLKNEAEGISDLTRHPDCDLVPLSLFAKEETETDNQPNMFDGVTEPENEPLYQAPDVRDAEQTPPETAEDLINRYFDGERNFSHADLEGVTLEGSNLCEADFFEANLKGANLQGSNLESVNFSKACLIGANILGANLQGGNFQDADLQNANLYGSNLSETHFEGANLNGCNLDGTNLQGCNIDISTLQQPEPTPAVVEPYSVVQSAPYPSYNPADPRLNRVQRELAALFGRPIEIYFNVDMMPRDGGVFMETFLDSKLGKVPQVIRGFQENHAQAFRSMTEALCAIDFDYDGSLDEAHGKFDEASGQLRIVLNGSAFHEELIRHIFSNMYTSWIETRYLNKAPWELDPAEYAQYFDVLVSNGRMHFSTQAAQLPKDQQEPRPGYSDVILRLLQLSDLVEKSDVALEKQITQQLLSDGEYFKDVYQHREAWLKGLKPSSHWLLAENYWMQWALDGLSTFDAETRYTLLQLLRVPSSGNRLFQHTRAFPGFDIIDFGFTQLEAWARAGHPSSALEETVANDAQIRLFDWIVRPIRYKKGGIRPEKPKNGSLTFYASALSIPASQERLISLIATTEDSVLKQTVILNMLEFASYRGLDRALSVQPIIKLLKRLEYGPIKWRELVHLLAVENGSFSELREALYDQAVLYYRTHSQDRDILLLLLARIDGYAGIRVDWKNFEKTYGAPISAKDMDQFFNLGYLAFEAFPSMWQAFDPTGSPGGVLASRLHQYLDADIPEDAGIYKEITLQKLSAALKDIKDLNGLKTFFHTLQNYIEHSPSKERVYRSTISVIQRDIDYLQSKLKSMN